MSDRSDISVGSERQSVCAIYFLDWLQTIQLVSWKFALQRIAVIMYGVNQGCSNCAGCDEVRCIAICECDASREFSWNTIMTVIWMWSDPQSTDGYRKLCPNFEHQWLVLWWYQGWGLVWGHWVWTVAVEYQWMTKNSVLLGRLEDIKDDTWAITDWSWAMFDANESGEKVK